MSKTGQAVASMRSFGRESPNAHLRAIDQTGNEVRLARNAIGSVPGSHTTNFFAKMAGGAWSNIKNFFSGIGSSMTAYFGHSANGGLIHRANGGQIQHLADGGPNGYVTGPGTTTSDSIPTLLSDKEYVVRAWAAKRIGISNLDQMNRTGDLPVKTQISTVNAVAAPLGLTEDNIANAIASAMRRGIVLELNDKGVAVMAGKLTKPLSYELERQMRNGR